MKLREWYCINSIGEKIDTIHTSSLTGRDIAVKKLRFLYKEKVKLKVKQLETKEGDILAYHHCSEYGEYKYKENE